MKILPYYREERKAKFSGAISLAENMNVLSVEDAYMISDYMQSCVVVEAWLSNSEDVVSKKPSIPSEYYSDGFYMWDASHIYYARKYHARLPVNFITHVFNQIKSGFDPNLLNEDYLKLEYNEFLEKLDEGGDCLYDGSY